MPSTDDRIVSMKFDNRAFEQQLQTTMESLKKLNESLQFKGTSKGLDNLADSARKISLEELGKSVDNVANKFSLFNAVAFSAIGNITNKAINSGLAIAKSLSLEQVLSGYQEYEMNISSIQTILANTQSKGSTLKDVNQALDELNAYSDQTIYNFGQMTKNIGTFTAAGVDLQTSVGSIKGIANVAALSGSSAEQASNAMYQLSQALATGKVKLLDWKSIENSGMGGEIFQKSLFETGKALGKLKGVNVNTTFDEWKKSAGSFRESLESGWLTADVMTTTLKAFTGDLTQAQLVALGYTEQQATEMAKTASIAKAAATNVKTLSQLLQVTKEAVGSGWSSSFRTIFGDFEQARDLFSGWYSGISRVVSSSSESRNKILKDWAALGGRSELIAGITILFNDFFLALAPIKKAFREIFPRKTGAELAAITVKFREFTQKLAMSSETADKVRRIFKGIFGAIEILSTVIKTVLGAFKALVGLFTRASGSSIVDFFAKLGDTILKLNNKLVRGGGIEKAFSKVFDVINKLGGYIASARNGFAKGFNGMSSAMQKAAGPINQAAFRIGQAVVKMVEFFKKFGPQVVDGVVKGFKTFYAIVVNLIKIGAAVIGVLAGVASATLSLGKAVSGYVVIGFQKLGGAIQAVAGWTESLTNVFGTSDTKGATGAIEKVASKTEKASSSFGILSFVMQNVTKYIGKFASVAGNVLGTLWDGIAAVFNSTTFGNVLETVRTVLLGGLVLMFKKFMKGGGLLDILGGAGFSRSIQGMFNGVSQVLMGVKDSLKALQLQIKAEAILRIAKALALLTISIVVLSFIDPVAIAFGLGALAGGMTVLSIAIQKLTKITLGPNGARDILVLTTSMILLSAAVLLLSTALEKLSKINTVGLVTGVITLQIVINKLITFLKALDKDIDPKVYFRVVLMLLGLAGAIKKLAKVIIMLGEIGMWQLAKGLAAFTFILNRLVWAVQKLPKGTDSKIKGLFLFGVSIYMMARAIKVLGSMDLWSLAKGLGAFTLMLGGLVWAVNKMKAKDMSSLSRMLLGLGVSLILMSVALGMLSLISLADLGKGILAIAGMLTVLVFAVHMLEGASAGIGMLTAVSVGLVMLAYAMTLLSVLSLADIGMGLLAIAGIIAVIAISGAAVQPILPALIGLGAALVLIGAGFALIGAGAYLFANALEVFIGAGSSAIDAAKKLILAIVSLIPDMVSAFVTGIASGFSQLLDMAPELIDGLTNVIIQLLQSIRKILPELRTTGLEVITTLLGVIAEKSPDFITLGFQLLMDFLKGLMKNIRQIAKTATDIAVEFIDGLTENLPRLSKSAADFIVAFLTGISANIVNISTAAAQVVAKFIEGIATNMSIIIPAATNLIVTFITGLGESMVAIQTAGADLIVKFIEGIGSNGLKIVNAAFDTLISFLNGLADSIRTHAQELSDAGGNILGAILMGIEIAVGDVETWFKGLGDKILTWIGEAGAWLLDTGKHIVTGLWDGIIGAKDWIMGKVKEMLDWLPGWAKDLLGISSPSKVFAEIGHYVSLGLAEGVVNSDSRKAIKASMTDMSNQVTSHFEPDVNAMKNTMNNTVAYVASQLQNIDDFQPKIRPVLDLTAVRKDATQLNGYLATSPITADISTRQASTLATTTQAQQDAMAQASSSGTEIKFEQNVYSPTALSVSDLYRQTRSQIKLAKEELSIL